MHGCGHLMHVGGHRLYAGVAIRAIAEYSSIRGYIWQQPFFIW